MPVPRSFNAILTRFIGFFSGVFFLIILSYLAFYVPRENFWSSYVLIICSFLFFLIVYKTTENLKWLFSLGLLIRLVLVFSTPELSDDFYRFLWDGAVTESGHNPFLYKPSEIINSGWLRPDFYDKFSLLNSPDYYTVYPTFIQLVDFVSVFLGQTFSGSLLVMKFIFLLGELFSFYFLWMLIKDSKREKQVYLYWLCPLVVIEFMGNLHFEAFMVTFLFASFYFFKKENLFWSAMFFVFACYTKLVPLAFFPFYLVVCKSKLKFSSYTLLFLILGGLPLIIDHGYLKVLESVKLYFGNFEFNSGIAYFGQKYRDQYPSLRIMIKVFSALSLIAVFILFYLKRFNYALGIALFYMVYLLFSQSIHPWYVLPLLPLFILHKIPLGLWVWIVLIGLSYITYQTAEYDQKEWVRIAQYGILIPSLFVELILYTRSSLSDF